MLNKWLIKCNKCGEKGSIRDMGMMKKSCETCKYKRWCSKSISSIYIWFFNNPFKNSPVSIAISFFVMMLFLSYLYPNLANFSVLAASFGTIFIALKYKLDQADYHKDLFEERYAIFLKLDEILSASFQDQDKNGNKIDWRYFSKELDSIYRKSYFLFGTETYRFLSAFRQAVVDLSCLKNNNTPHDPQTKKMIDEARAFLARLLDGQNLSKKFPELKIDSY